MYHHRRNKYKQKRPASVMMKAAMMPPATTMTDSIIMLSMLSAAALPELGNKNSSACVLQMKAIVESCLYSAHMQRWEQRVFTYSQNSNEAL